jgi:hypothetical protein
VTHRDIISRLASADPAAALQEEHLTDSLDHLGTAITANPRPARRVRVRRSRRVVLGAVAATAVLAGGATAAATLLDAHTGQRARGWQVAAGGPGEYLRESAPNFCRVALQAGASVPYPSGDQAWRRWVLVAEAGVHRVTLNGSCASTTQHGQAEVSTGALRGWFAMSAFCAWTYQWRDARLSGDRRAEARAAAQIAAAPRWSAVTAEDPHPGERTLFGWFLTFRRAVKRGDLTAVDHLIAANYGGPGCRYFKPPAASRGGTVNPLGLRS